MEKQYSVTCSIGCMPTPQDVWESERQLFEQTHARRGFSYKGACQGTLTWTPKVERPVHKKRTGDVVVELDGGLVQQVYVVGDDGQPRSVPYYTLDGDKDADAEHKDYVERLRKHLFEDGPHDAE